MTRARLKFPCDGRVGNGLNVSCELERGRDGMRRKNLHGFIVWLEDATHLRLTRVLLTGTSLLNYTWLVRILVS